MQVNKLIAALVERSGKSFNAVSAELGRSREYARQASSKQAPSIATVTDIADACGYDVQLVSRDTGAAITVTPPRRC